MADQRSSRAAPPRAHAAGATSLETAARTSPREAAGAERRDRAADDGRGRRRQAVSDAPARR